MSAGTGAGGQGVYLPVPEELEPVLDRPQEPVRGGQALGVRAGDVAAGGQRAERGQRGRGAEAFVLAPVHELEELYGKLDVPYTAPAELYLPL